MRMLIIKYLWHHGVVWQKSSCSYSQVGSLQRAYSDASLGKLVPAELTAATRNWYSLPSNRPVILSLVS